MGSRAGMRTQQRPASVRDEDTSSLQGAKCWQRPCPEDGSRDPTCHLGAECPTSGPRVTASLAPPGSHLISEGGWGWGGGKGSPRETRFL